MPSTVTLKASGLNTNPNQLELPEGSLIEATNVVISRDNVIEQRRGFKLYGESFGDSLSRSRQMFEYKDRILRHYANTLQFQNGTLNDGNVNFDSFYGSYSEPDPSARIKKIDASGNLYFTTSDGIKKISAKTASQLSTSPGYIVQAGGVKAVDFTASLVVTPNNQTGFLPQDSAVAYRVVWGIIDANDNLILGAPSQREEIYNPLSRLLIQDFLRGLNALDNVSDNIGSLINDGNYVDSLRIPISATAVEIQSALVSLATKIDVDLLYANDLGVGAPLQIGSAAISAGICTITFSYGQPTDYFSPGDKIYLSNFIPGTSGTLNGIQTVANVSTSTLTFNTDADGTVTTTGSTIQSGTFRDITEPVVPEIPTPNSQMVALQNYYYAILTGLQSLSTTPAGDGSPPPISASSMAQYIDPLDITTSAQVELTITIPDGITPNYFFQVYRSGIAQATGTTSILDVVPNDELQQVYEAYPTAAQLAAKEVSFVDITPDDFRGANLYTNAATGEGILQANDLPPYAIDINRFKNVVFYANTRTRHKKNLNLIGVQNMIDDYNNGITPRLSIISKDGENTYTFVTGVNEEIDITTNAASTLNQSGAGSHFLIQSAEDAKAYYVWYKVNTPAVAQVEEITCVADVGGSLNDTYFLIDNVGGPNYYVWYNVGGSGTDPMIPGRTGVQVNLLSGATDDTVASNTSSALNGISGAPFGTTDTLNVIEITHNNPGAIGDATNGTSSPGFSYSVIVNGANAFSTTDPAVADRTGISVVVNPFDPNSVVASNTRDSLNSVPVDFFATSSGNVVTVTLTSPGYTTDASDVDTGFTFTIVEDGRGEDAANNQVLLSSAVSVATAVDETARSLIRVINKNSSEQVYAYYLSGNNDIPGKFYFEEKDLEDVPFYLITNNETTGTSFTPDLSPTLEITGITTGITPVVTTSSNHNLSDGESIVLSYTDSTPEIDGVYEVKVISPTQFQIETVNVTIAGTEGVAVSALDAVTSENERKVNRVYYSKVSQPEAVPLLNYLDVGDSDKEILRIFPLRDSLFVFKEDGLYRISGETAPFPVALFDSSCIITSPDTLSVSNNLLYCLTTQGICAVSEGGVEIISNPIKNIIDRIQILPNFKSLSFGVGYESDESYTMYTTIKGNEESAVIGYRYGTNTNTWTTVDKKVTCGFINPVDDKMYLGAGDTNYIEQERKSYTRLDFADREYTMSLIDNNYLPNNTMRFLNVDGVSVGDVLVQEQTLTIYEFNMLLKKLDSDPGISDNNYFSSLQAVAGDNLRDKILALATKLDLDPGVADTDYFSSIETKQGSITAILNSSPSIITANAHGLLAGRYVQITSSDSVPDINGSWKTVSPINANQFALQGTSVAISGTSGTYATLDNSFEDIVGCYNIIMRKLSNDSGVAFSIFRECTTTTTFEVIITGINVNQKTITVNMALDFIQGPLTRFAGINTVATYGPTLFGDPINYKHLRESTMMFANKAFSNAELSFATDLLPRFIPVPFKGDGNGVFGHSEFGTGFFGGASHSAPFRTYIPRQCQRCRYILVRFNHKVAREIYSIFGMTITGENTGSPRAYRG